jgi:hypothetical protein
MKVKMASDYLLKKSFSLNRYSIKYENQKRIAILQREDGISPSTN